MRSQQAKAPAWSYAARVARGRMDASASLDARRSPPTASRNRGIVANREDKQPFKHLYAVAEMHARNILASACLGAPFAPKEEQHLREHPELSILVETGRAFARRLGGSGADLDMMEEEVTRAILEDADLTNIINDTTASTQRASLDAWYNKVWDKIRGKKKPKKGDAPAPTSSTKKKTCVYEADNLEAFNVSKEETSMRIAMALAIAPPQSAFAVQLKKDLGASTLPAGTPAQAAWVDAMKSLACSEHDKEDVARGTIWSLSSNMSHTLL